jgi:hypothetical protein
MRAYSRDLRKKTVWSVKKGVSKCETARRFGLDEKVRRLLWEDLEERPWVTHFQRTQFLAALLGCGKGSRTVTS